MSVQPEGSDATRRFAATYDADDYGTLLGSLAWVLGALEIMRDRGHAEDDESFHDLHDALQPRLERLLDALSKARSQVPPSDEINEAIEAGYARVREAFEVWIQLTAVDTAGIAIEQRRSEQLEAREPGDEDSSR